MISCWSVSLWMAVELFRMKRAAASFKGSIVILKVLTWLLTRTNWFKLLVVFRNENFCGQDLTRKTSMFLDCFRATGKTLILLLPLPWEFPFFSEIIILAVQYYSFSGINQLIEFFDLINSSKINPLGNTVLPGYMKVEQYLNFFYKSLQLWQFYSNK